MLITFKSGAAADVIMFGDAARTLLKVLGKDPNDDKGIVTVEQLPGAIAALKSAIEENRHHHDDGKDGSDEDENPRGMGAPVSFAQRAWPLLDMLEYSLKEHKPVTWGT